MAQWLSAHESVRVGLVHAWATLQQDALLRLVWVDMGVFTLAALVWLWWDASKRKLPWAQHTTWILATLVLGCPGLLTYLAFRDRATGKAGATNAVASA